jgi:hypothetical protein
VVAPTTGTYDVLGAAGHVRNFESMCQPSTVRSGVDGITNGTALLVGIFSERKEAPPMSRLIHRSAVRGVVRVGPLVIINKSGNGRFLRAVARVAAEERVEATDEVALGAMLRS